MRCLDRNKTACYYATFKDLEEQLDEYGNYTGIYNPIYNNPVKLSANISPAKGSTSVKQFGIQLDYSKVLVVSGSCPISEDSVLWIDTLPELETDGSTTTPYDYVVAAVAKSFHSTAYALKKVDVQNG